VVGVTLLAQFLGAGKRGQIFAAVFCVTLPQGILQASGAKNDYVVAFWFVALVYYLMSFKRQPDWTNACGVGAALGLAWLTKGTAYIFSLAIVMTWALAWPWKVKMAWLRHLPLIGLLVLALNAGHFLRNYQLMAPLWGL
jgi:4-amino-4-deoxy-L-arabinose transferase-like glycosyltransferase